MIERFLLGLAASRAKPTRPSVRVGVPWSLAFLTWVVAARLALGPGGFDASWTYWLPVGLLAIPLVVAGASMLVGVGPSWTAMLAAAAAGGVATTISVLALRASREPFTFAILGAFLIGLLTTVAYVVATSRGEEARRDAGQW